MPGGFGVQLGKLLVAFGAAIVVLGLILIVTYKFPWWVGRLPGNVVYKGKHWNFYFPLITCVVISAVVTLIVWLLSSLDKLLK